MNWKTTTCGILAAVAAGITLVAIPILDGDPATVANWGVFAAAVMAAIGLFVAKDHDKP